MNSDTDYAQIADAAATFDPHICFRDRRTDRVTFDLNRGRRFSQEVNGERLLVVLDFNVIEAVQVRGADSFASIFRDANLGSGHTLALVR